MTEAYISDRDKSMFEELMRAAQNNDLVLVACSGELDRSKRYSVLCAVNENKETEDKDKEISLVPFARILNPSEVDWMRPMLDHETHRPSEEE